MNLSNSAVKLFPTYYWDYQCVEFAEPTLAYCDFLWANELYLCMGDMTADCLQATVLRQRICGIWTSTESEGEEDESEEGSGAEGSGASGR